MSEPTAAEFKAIFEDDKRGAAILEHLIRRFPPKVITQGGIDAVLETYRRAAHREILEFIVNKINQANGVHDQPDAEAGE